MIDAKAELGRRRERIEQALEQALPAEAAWPATLHRAMRYSVFAGGKRIRPQLVLAACDAVGSPCDAALDFACAAELVHTFSLIHDDLPAMDDDDLRRGQPTNHKVFGEAVAILAGDALLARAFELVSGRPDADPAQLVRQARAGSILAAACGSLGLIGGQTGDIEAEGREVSATALESIHRAKTGALLTACVQGGGVLAGASPEDEQRLRRFGSAIGLAFQVVDDILDATESAETLGKTAGKDTADRKATYVGVHGLDAARAQAHVLLGEALAELRPFAERALLLESLARQIVERHA